MCVDAAGMALILDKGSTIDDPSSFPLLKTMYCHSLLKLEMKLNVVKMVAYKLDSNVDFEFGISWSSNDPLCFLMNCKRDFSCHMLGYEDDEGNQYPPGHPFNDRSQIRIRSLIRALCDLGILCPDPHTRPAYFFDHKEFYLERKGSRVKSYSFLSTLFDALNQLFLIKCFNTDTEYFVSEWIRNGLICAQMEEQIGLYGLIDSLHINHNLFGNEGDMAKHLSDIAAAHRVARQLLALGLFRVPHGDPKLSWARRCLYDEWASRQGLLHCEICCDGHNSQTTQECPVIEPLINEFFRQPLSLLQLSRIEIRCSLGINCFERRIRTLPLPPCLLTYVWHANEMLSAEVSNWV